MANSDMWVYNKPEKNLAFTLVRDGYDVWLGNNRGNSHSLLHKTKDITSMRLYDVDMAVLVKYDLTKMIDEVLQITKQEDLTFIGHSYGATQMFYALAQDEDKWDEKINLFIALAPILKIDSGKDSFINEWATGKQSEHFRKDLVNLKLPCMLNPIFDDEEDELKVHHQGYFKMMRNAFFNEVDGFNEKIVCQRKHPADTVRVAELDHLSKILKAKEFVDGKGDKVDLSKIKEVKIIVLIGSNDSIVNPADGKWIKSQLKTVDHFHEIKKFNHSSFLLAKDMSYTKEILSDLKKFNPVKK